MDPQFQTTALAKFYTYDKQTQKMIVYQTCIIFLLLQHFNDHIINNTNHYITYIMLYITIYNMLIILYKYSNGKNETIEYKLLQLKLFTNNYYQKQ